MIREDCVRAAIACIETLGPTEGERKFLAAARAWTNAPGSAQEKAARQAFFTCAHVDGHDPFFGLYQLLVGYDLGQAWEYFLTAMAGAVRAKGDR